MCGKASCCDIRPGLRCSFLNSLSRSLEETELATPSAAANMSKDHPLKDQVALVTGAGRRIGRVIALRLAEAGANVVVNYNESHVEAERTAREIQELGVESVAIRADVSKPSEVSAMFAAVEKRFRRLDVLVNNAGIFFP